MSKIDKEQIDKFVIPQSRISHLMEELGCTGKRIKPKAIVDRIVEVEFKKVTICGTLFMFCGIAMKGNDQDKPFVVVGAPSVCIDPDNFRDEIGREVSFNNSFQDIYKLEAYRVVTGNSE